MVFQNAQLFILPPLCPIETTMTRSEILLIFLLVFILIDFLIYGYRKWIKKKETKRKIILLLWTPFLFYLVLWNGSYFTFLSEYSREINDIPIIEETMHLKYRSRFKELWTNEIKAEIRHASKVIRLGNTIEQEIDFYTNSYESKTLVIENTLQFFSSDFVKDYYLLKGIVINDDYFRTFVKKTNLTEIEKDSILVEWNINEQLGTTKAKTNSLR